MNSLQYADRILAEFRRGKKAASVARGDQFLECLIICTDGTVERVTGYWASEIMKRKDAESLSP